MERLLRGLDRANHKNARNLEAWSMVLDSLGWCVAFRGEKRQPYLNPRADEWWTAFDRGNGDWFALMESLRNVAPASFLVRSETICAWAWQPVHAAADPPRPGGSGLTRREAEILGWMRQGKSGPEVAIILGCARRTVETHVARIYKKLGVRNSAQLMVQTPPFEG